MAQLCSSALPVKHEYVMLQVRFKGIVHKKMNIMSSFTHLHVALNFLWNTKEGTV